MTPGRAGQIRVAVPPKLSPEVSQGTGFLVRSDGLVLAGFHVVEGGNTIKVRCQGYELVTARPGSASAASTWTWRCCTRRSPAIDFCPIQTYIEHMRQTTKARNPGKPRHELKVADEVWLAAALLHREHPDRADFTVAEIVERARQEGLTPELRPGVYVHAVLHCVANRPPNPGRYLMLVETGPNRRRLYRPGDPADEARRGAKMTPARSAIPPKYHPLLDWYEREYAPQRGLKPEADPLLALRGSGRELWADEHADQYVRRLREGWE